MSTTTEAAEHVADVWLVATRRHERTLARIQVTTRRPNHEVRLPEHLTGPSLVLSVHCSCGATDEDDVRVLALRDAS